MKKIIEQNKNTCVILFFFFVLISFSVSADSSSTSSFVPIPYSSSDVYDSSWLSQGVYNRFNNIYISSSVPNSYVCYIEHSPYVQLLYISLNPFTLRSYEENTHRYNSSNSTLSDSVYIVGPGYSSDGPVTLNPSIPTFSSVSDALSSFLSFVSVTTYPLSVSLPAGNMIIVDLDGFDYSKDRYWSVTTHFEYPTVTGFAQNQIFGQWDSIPNPITIPPSGYVGIDYQPNGNPTFTGLYYDLARTYVLDYNPGVTGRYLYVINPYRAADSDEQDANPTMNLYFSQASAYQILALRTDMTNSPFGQWTNVDGDSWSGNYDPDTGLWDSINDQTGEPGGPVTGGGNAISPQSTINQWLQNIANQIASFFSGAIGAVSTLVNAGSQFFSRVSGLYTWLPSQVYSVLVSALILVITIGVIKVFI